MDRSMLSGSLASPSRSPVHVIFPWMDPCEARSDAISRVKSQLERTFSNVCVMNSLIRRGSLILSMDVLLLEGKGNESTHEQLLTHEWLDMLNLPEARDGEPLIIQVGNSNICLVYDAAFKEWRKQDGGVPHFPQGPTFSMKAPPAIAMPGPGAQSVSLQLDLLQGVSLLQPDTANPVQSEGGVVLKMHCQGHPLPLSWTPVNADGKVELVFDTRPLPNDHVPQEPVQLPGLVTLEAWSGYKIVQSIPLLLLPHSLSCVAEELSSLNPLPAEDGLDNLAYDSQLLASWLEYVGQCTNNAKAGGDVEDRLRAYMVDAGRKMVSHSILNGLLKTSALLVNGMLESLHVPLDDVWKPLPGEGNTLLHQAVLSCQEPMVQQVLGWAAGRNSVWNEENDAGATPLHLAAFADPGFSVRIAIVSAESRAAWLNSNGTLGCSPAQFCKHMHRQRNPCPTQEDNHSRVLYRPSTCNERRFSFPASDHSIASDSSFSTEICNWEGRPSLYMLGASFLPGISTGASRPQHLALDRIGGMLEVASQVPTERADSSDTFNKVSNSFAGETACDEVTPESCCGCFSDFFTQMGHSSWAQSMCPDESEVGLLNFKSAHLRSAVWRCCVIRSFVVLGLAAKQFLLGRPPVMYLLKLLVAYPLLHMMVKGFKMKDVDGRTYNTQMLYVWYFLRFMMHAILSLTAGTQDSVEAWVQPITDLAGAASEPMLFRNGIYINMMGALSHMLFFTSNNFRHPILCALLVHGAAVGIRYTVEEGCRKKFLVSKPKAE